MHLRYLCISAHMWANGLELQARMDAMLVRQYNLIQCFSNPKATKNDLDDTTVGESKPAGVGSELHSS